MVNNQCRELINNLMSKWFQLPSDNYQPPWRLAPHCDVRWCRRGQCHSHVMYHTQKYLKACSAHLFSKNQSQKTSMFYRVGFPLTGFDPQERNFGLVLSHSCKWEIYVPVTFRSSLTPWGLTAVADRRDLPGGLIAVADRRDLPGGLIAVADLDCSGELCLIPVVSSKVLLCPL